MWFIRATCIVPYRISNTRWTKASWACAVQKDEALLTSTAFTGHMQLHRDSRVTVTESAEDYYRSRTVYIPFLDSIIRQFNERSFTHARIQPCDLSHYCQVRGLCVKHYVWQRNWGTDNVSPSDSRWWRPADIVRLQCRWPDVSTSERPTDCPLALAACDKTFYRYIHVLLLISVSLPLSTAMPERTFSAMKTLKIYLHSRLTNSITAVYQCVIACYSLGFQ